MSSTPASNDNLVNADKSQVGTTDFGRSAQQDTLTAGAYNDITLNANGLTNISKTGISKFGGVFGFDFDNTTTGLTWASGVFQAVSTAFADTAGTTNDPKLVITYTPASVSGTMPLLGIG